MPPVHFLKTFLLTSHFHSRQLVSAIDAFDRIDYCMDDVAVFAIARRKIAGAGAEPFT